MTSLADQVCTILEDRVKVPVQNGKIKLRERGVMDVEVDGVPPGATVVNMRRIGSFSGLGNGPWKKICDFLLVWRSEGMDRAIFVELKKTLSDGIRGSEQLRRSLPYLDYLRAVCRIEYCSEIPSRRVPVRYVLIGKRSSPKLAKQRVTRGYSFPDMSHRGITVKRLVGRRFRFARLRGGK